MSAAPVDESGNQSRALRQQADAKNDDKVQLDDSSDSIAVSRDVPVDQSGAHSRNLRQAADAIDVDEVQLEDSSDI